MGSWWSGRRRDASERLGPKIAYVFDEDVNIYNDERVKWAIAWRYNVALIASPQKETRTRLWSNKLLSGAVWPNPQAAATDWYKLIYRREILCRRIMTSVPMVRCTTNSR